MMQLNKEICIFGLGYVGLPLAVEFAKKFKTIGFDINTKRINHLKNNIDETLEVESETLESLSNQLLFTSSIDDVRRCSIYIVTVPTPIDTDNKPDLSPLINASKDIGSILSKENIVIYESTVYPGVTEEICAPILEKTSGLKFNKDFYCGYSPERINPGDKENKVSNIIKVTSGSSPEVAKLVDELYSEIIEVGTYLAPSIKIAEASKVIENTQRDVNIALINEFAVIFNQLGIDTQEVLNAADTKWNFNKYTPGLVGGHCIGVDPYYLTYKSEELGYRPDLILTARMLNNSMSKFIAEQTVKKMISSRKDTKNADVLILGVTFKENCPDIRNSKVVNLINELKHLGLNVDVYDSLVNPKDLYDEYQIIANNNLSNFTNKEYAAVIYAVAHDDIKSISSEVFGDAVIIDIKGAADKYTWRL